jgi:hypothetical protein
MEWNGTEPFHSIPPRPGNEQTLRVPELIRRQRKPKDHVISKYSRAGHRTPINQSMQLVLRDFDVVKSELLKVGELEALYGGGPGGGSLRCRECGGWAMNGRFVPAAASAIRITGAPCSLSRVGDRSQASNVAPVWAPRGTDRAQKRRAGARWEERMPDTMPTT